MKYIQLILACLLLSLTAYGQDTKITGIVKDATEPLIGASVYIGGTTKGAITNYEGRYEITLDAGTYMVAAGYLGYNTQEQKVTLEEGQEVELNFELTQGLLVDEVVVIGTRASNRTNMEAAVPVDVLNVEKLTAAAPQTNINQLLHTTAPSFSSNTQTIADGTDHIDPASLRGLGPDQVLVLLNGKRRHTSSLINVNGTFGRGTVGTDLNAIPATAVSNIEVLRDGAAAQYGSDAIAGVINVRLRNDVNKLRVNVTTGANLTSQIGPFGGETPAFDGETVNVGLNYGLPIGERGGFINFTGEFGYRGKTNRMQEFEGGIFNRLNGIERVAAADGADVSKLTMSELQSYAGQVSYFDATTQADIAAASDMATLATVLGVDATDAELSARGMQRSDFNMLVGQSEVREGKFFANMEIPLGENAVFYGNGGMNYRRGCSGCFYRLPNQNRTTTSIYLNGTVPRINSDIYDLSATVGLRGSIGEWAVDFSNVYGSNSFLFYMTNTHNATLGASSPTEFNSGGHSFTQNTTNFDVSRYFDLPKIKGINLAFGAEYRYENYKIIPGTEQSYGNYDVNGNLVTPTTADSLLTRDLLGRSRPAGAQCFAGFLPSNEVDANRSSAAVYVDSEFDISDALLIAAAVRFENYSDFGSNFNYKVAARYKITKDIVVRAAHSTGFRAPSLHQIHFSRTSTIFEIVNGVSVPLERGTFANTSRAAKLLGIPDLKQETSMNFSAGFTIKIPNLGLRFTVDGYLVNIDDRVVLTGAFSAGNDAELQQIFDAAQAGSANFFANAISTNTRGIDVVISHKILIGQKGVLTNDLAGNFTQTVWDQSKGISSSDLLREKGLEDTYFDQLSRLYLEQAIPRIKATLSNTFTYDKKLSVYLRNTYFGRTTEATNAALFDQDLNWVDQSINPYYSGKVITDLSVGYNFTKGFSLTIGANNLFDVYPDLADPSFQSSGRFLYSRRSPQFSFGGRYVFARLLFTLE